MKTYKFEIKSTNQNLEFEVEKNGEIDLHNLNFGANVKKSTMKKLTAFLECFSELDECCGEIIKIKINKI